MAVDWAVHPCVSMCDVDRWLMPSFLSRVSGAVQMLPDAARGELTWRQEHREMFGQDVSGSVSPCFE